MYAEAKVLKSVKGNLSLGRVIRFGASAWVGPSYRAGERRIVLLQRLPARHEYFQKAHWSSLDAGKLNLFIEERTLDSFSRSSFSDFLHRLSEASRTRPAIKWIRIGTMTALTLSFILHNDSDQTLWLNRSHLRVSFQVGEVRHQGAIEWNVASAGQWIPFRPGSTLSATVRIRSKDLAGQSGGTVSLEHWSALFPHVSWVGVQSAKVP